MQRKKHTAAQTHSQKRALWVPAQTHGNNVSGEATQHPLPAGHAGRLSFPVPCPQASCVVRFWGRSSTASSPWGSTWQEGRHRPLHLHLSPPAPHSQLWPGETKIRKGFVVQSRGKDFSDSTCDPRLSFLSLETTNPKVGGGVEGRLSVSSDWEPQPPGISGV